MTTNETLSELLKSGKKVGLTRLYYFFGRLKIAPIGARQRPQQYPADTASRILQHLGFSSGAPSKPSTPRADDAQRAAGIMSLKQLKTHKPRRKK